MSSQTIDEKHESASLVPWSADPMVGASFAALYERLVSPSILPQPPRIVGITSCRRGDGASTVALGLALAAAEAADPEEATAKVLLVDADFLAPALHRALTIEQGPGLLEVVGGSHALDQAVQPSGIDNLWVLPVGLAQDDAAEDKPGMGMPELFAELAIDFSFIVVDLPPIDRLDATLGAGSAVDGVVLVIEAEGTGRNRARTAAQAILQGSLLGAVLNKFQDPDLQQPRDI